MKKFSLIVCLFIVATAITIVSCNNQNDKPVAVTADGISMDSMIHRGEYLVTIMACDDCHSPKKMGPQGPEVDMDRRLSGHPAQMPAAKINKEAMKEWVLFNMTGTEIAGPWGVSYTANLTPSESGIGNWTEQQFIKALREGKLKGMDNSRPILPPMPWQNIGKASDNDLRSIFAYLKSLKPVDNVVPAPKAPQDL